MSDSIGTVQRIAWNDLPQRQVSLRPGELALGPTLTCGQAFRWSRRVDGAWQGVFADAAWLLWQEPERLNFKCCPDRPTDLLASYLRLDFDLSAWAETMAGREPRLDLALKTYRGLRLLKQNPVEVALTFCVAAGNSYPVIVESVDLMCRKYGEPIAIIDGGPVHDFPTLDALAGADEGTLAMDCRLDYRAANLIRLARRLKEQPVALSDALVGQDYRQVKADLTELPSVGLTTADWISLFGLGYDQAVPIDVHLWNLARQMYPDHVTTKTLTPKTYEKIAMLFQETFGETAGWAQEYLYYGARRGLFRQRR